MDASASSRAKEISRVVVEQESDWIRVQSNAEAALKASLDARLATLPGGSTGETAKRFRPVLEELLRAIQTRMWELTRPNLIVNGFKYEEFVETTEPFDEALDRQIWAVNTERVMWETKARERRMVMADQVYDLLGNIEERRAAATWRPTEADLAAEVSAAPDVRPEDVPIPPRHAEVVDTFSTVVGNLSELAKAAPQQLERAKRVHVVQEEMARLPV